MDLQERLIELSEYGVSFNVAKDNFVIKINYNPNWMIIQPECKDIGFYRDDTDENVYYYVAPVSLGIEKIFASIDETIEYNRELELKVELFKKKMTELQDIFTNETLEVLNTLEFKFKKKKDKPKKEKVQKTDIKEETKQEESDKEQEIVEGNGKMSDIDNKISEILKEKC